MQNCRINRPKTPKNHLRQHWKTKGSELYLSDCPQADFGDEMVRFAVFMKHFSGSLAPCRDRPLAYQIADVTSRGHKSTGLSAGGCIRHSQEFPTTVGIST